MSAQTELKQLESVLDGFNELPFLFIGSGMSIRYLQLPNWQGLLEVFANQLLPDNPLAIEALISEIPEKSTSTKSSMDSMDILPDLASLIETRFNRMWLQDASHFESRKDMTEEIKSGISPFKLEVANYLIANKRKTQDKHLLDELSCLKNVAKRSIAGVITTNYDSFAEEVFEDYEVFIGQEELLFARTQGVAEIYKIHGCFQHPETLVLTREDYARFSERNAYLAAKLLTIFIEHPVFFLGYSITDPNIQEILRSIVFCLSQENLEKLQKRLIFVEYEESRPYPSIQDYSINFDSSTTLDMTRIRLSDYMPLYKLLLNKRYQYNPKLLRQLKRDIYRLVADNVPCDRFQVADIEDDKELENVDVVVGVGVGKSGNEMNRGHNIPTADQLYQDILFDDGNFDLGSLVESALAKLLNHHSRSLPIHKYVSLYKRKWPDKTVPLEVTKDLKFTLDEYLNKQLIRRREQNPAAEQSIRELVDQYGADEALIMIVLLQPNKIQLDELEHYLKNYLNRHPGILSGDKPTTELKRLIKIYDWMKYGKEKEPSKDGS